MAYVPQHLSDVFISYCHDDDYAWIERFQSELYTVLTRKLRSRTKPTFFFDNHALRAGRVFDAEIAEAVEKTGFFVAMVTPRYNTSDYCRHEELAAFLRRKDTESTKTMLEAGRLIQVHLDDLANLPALNSLSVEFFKHGRPLRPESDGYQDALRRVYEPIATELDRLYAKSKLVFLAYPGDASLREERKRLKDEIEGRGLRLYDQLVTEHEGDVRLREALTNSTTSVHFFAETPDPFALRQWQAAVALGKPCVLASRNPAEARRGPDGAPPIYLSSGCPTVAIAKAIEQIVNIGSPEARASQRILNKPQVFLSLKADEDKRLGFDLNKSVFKGQFDFIERPGRDHYADAVARARLVMLCREKANREWFRDELNALTEAMDSARCFDTPRILRMPEGDSLDGLDLLEGDHVVRSNDEFRAMLTNVMGGTKA